MYRVISAALNDSVVRSKERKDIRLNSAHFGSTVVPRMTLGVLVLWSYFFTWQLISHSKKILLSSDCWDFKHEFSKLHLLKNKKKNIQPDSLTVRICRTNHLLPWKKRSILVFSERGIKSFFGWDCCILDIIALVSNHDLISVLPTSSWPNSCRACVPAERNGFIILINPMGPLECWWTVGSPSLVPHPSSLLCCEAVPTLSLCLYTFIFQLFLSLFVSSASYFFPV